MSVHLEQEVADFSERRLRLANAITDYSNWLDQQHGIDAERSLRLTDAAAGLRQDKLVEMAKAQEAGYRAAIEAAEAWEIALEHRTGPVAMIFARQCSGMSFW